MVHTIVEMFESSLSVNKNKEAFLKYGLWRIVITPREPSHCHDKNNSSPAN